MSTSQNDEVSNISLHIGFSVSESQYSKPLVQQIHHYDGQDTQTNEIIVLGYFNTDANK